MIPVDPLAEQAERRAADSGIGSAVRFVTSGYRRAIVAIAGASFVGGLAEAVFLVTITRLAFAITDGDDRVGILADWYVTIDQTLLLAVGLVTVRIVLSAAAIWMTAVVSTSAVARLRRRLAHAFLSSSWEIQQDQQGGTLQQLLTEFGAKASTVMNGVSSTVVSVCNLLGMLGLALAVDPPGSVVMLVSIAVFAAVLLPVRNAVRRRAKARNQANMALATRVNETSQLGMELHVFNVQDRAEKRLIERIDEAQDRARRLQVANSSMSTVYSGLAYFALIAALAVGARSDASSLTSLGAVMLVMLRSLSYGQKLQGAYLGVVEASPAIDELREHLSVLDEGGRTDRNVGVGSVGVIEAERVSFAYPDGRAVLHEVSFRIEPNEVVGIVGPSGGGKSTLVQLLLGLRDPQLGSIRSDGRDIGEFSRPEWARKVTFVPQSPQFIDGSVADNIRFLRADLSEDALIEAARLAYLHDDIMKFPEGYERQVGQRGGHLSGGQQQRLCIARALVEHPDVLILDEPTSALDVKSEHQVRSTLERLRASMTIVIIAHRLSTLDMCDRIMVIQDGQLMGFDSPDRLEQSSDFFREALGMSGLR